MVARVTRGISIFFVWLFAYLLSYFYRSANAVIAGDLRAEVGLGNEQLGFMTSLFYLAFAVVQLPLGAALDRWGSRVVTPTLMLVGALGSLVFALGDTFLVLSIGRALLGMGFAGVLMGAMKAFSAWFADGRFATVSSLLVGIGSTGALLAGTPLAWLAGQVGWRAIFAWGAAIVVLAATVIVVASRNAPAGAEWRAAGGSRAGFGAILRDHRFWRVALLNFATVGAILSVQGLWGGPYLADVYGMSDLQVGNTLVALGIGAVIGNLSCGWLADRFGRGVVVLVGASVFLTSQALLALALPAMPVALLYLTFGLFGSYFVVLVATVRSIFPAELTGRAITGINFFGMGGAMVVQSLMGVLIEAGGGVSGYRVAFLLTAALGTVAALLFLPVAREAQRRLETRVAHGEVATR